VKLNKTDEQVVAALQGTNGLGLDEIAEKTGQPTKKVFRSLRKLFENEIIDSQARKYKLLITDPKAIKAKLATKKEDEPEE
jgi:DNA-binding IclR family transcriptional regulator